MRIAQKLIIIGAAVFMIGGCAYRYYLGFHGPSIKLHPDVHAQVTEDEECLECHHPDRNPEGPPHPIRTLKGV